MSAATRPTEATLLPFPPPAAEIAGPIHAFVLICKALAEGRPGDARHLQRKCLEDFGWRIDRPRRREGGRP